MRRPKILKFIFLFTLSLCSILSIHSLTYGQAEGKKPLLKIQQLIKKKDNKKQSSRNTPADWKEAILALSRIGKEVVPDLTEALRNKSVHVRRGAAAALGLIGLKAVDAIPALAEAANDNDLETSIRATSAMGAMGKAAVPALMKIMKDKSKKVNQRANAAFSLIRIGKPAIPALLEALRSKDKEIRGYATGTLGRMGSQAKGAVRALEKIARGDSDRNIRRAALMAIQKIDPFSDAVVSELLRTVQDKEKYPQERLQALDTLTIFGSTKDGKLFPVIPDLPAVLTLVLNDEENAMRLRKKAAIILGQIGDRAAAPALTEALANPSLFSTALHALKRSGPQEEVLIPSLITLARWEGVKLQMRRKAIHELGEIGSTAKSAVPAIAEISRIKGFRDASITALRKIDPDGQALASVYFKAMQTGTHADRRAFLREIASQGLQAKAAIPALIKTLRDKDKDAYVRGGAATALSKMGPEAEGAIPELIKILKSGDTNERWVRQEALSALAHIGKAAVPALVETLRHENQEVRYLALNSIMNIQQEANEAVSTLMEMIKDKNKGPTERRMAASVLSSVGPEGEWVILDLIEIFTDEGEYANVRSEAVTVLGFMGPEAEVAVPALMASLSHEDLLFRSRVTETLIRIAPDRKEVVNALIESMKDEKFRLTTAFTLARIGTSTIPSLIEALKHSDKNVRIGAITALNKLGSDDAVPALMDALKDREPGVRSRAARVLGRIGKPTKQTTSLLIKLLEDKDPLVRQGAAFAIGQIKPKADEAIPALIKTLKDQDVIVRTAVVDSLGNFGPAAVPALAERATDQNENVAVRRRAVTALKMMGSEAKAAAPAFIEALKDLDAFVRHEALKALRQLGPDAKAAIPVLMKELENPETHSVAIGALMGIVEGMIRANHIDASQEVERIKKILANHPDPKIKRYAFSLEENVEQGKKRIK